MAAATARFVARAEAGNGWRVYDRQMRKWWGTRSDRFPEELLAELNGPKRPERIVELTRGTKRKL
jgi:hypothetical protein